MAHCPKCQSEIHEDFGVVTCQACGATLIIDLDGKVRDFQEESNLQPTTESEINLSESSPQEFQTQPYVQSSLDESPNNSYLESEAPLFSSEGLSKDSLLNIDEFSSVGETPPSEVTHQNLQESQVGFDVGSQVDSELDSEEVGSAIEEFDQWAETVPEEPYLEDEYKSDLSETEDELWVAPETGVSNLTDSEESTNYKIEPSSTEEVLSEVKDFGNSEASGAEDGLFLYTLRLDGIDSGEVKSHVLQALKDPRLKMDAEKIVDGIKNGHITIRKLNAVKAIVIVNAVKSLPIDIFWEQHDITS